MKKLLLMVLVVCAALLPAAAGADAKSYSDEQSSPLNLGSQYNIGLHLETFSNLVGYLQSKDSTLPDPSAGSSPFDYSDYYRAWETLGPGSWTTDPTGPIEILDSASQPTYHDLDGNPFWDAAYVTCQWKSGVTASDGLSGTVTYTLGDYAFVLKITPGQYVLTSSVTGAAKVHKQSEILVSVFAPVGQTVTLTANLTNRLTSGGNYTYYWYEWDNQTATESLLNPQSNQTRSISLSNETDARTLTCYVYDDVGPSDPNDPYSGNVQASFQFNLSHESAALPNGPGNPGVPAGPGISAVPAVSAASPDVPATGDESLPLLWLLGLMASSGAIVLLRRRAKRNV